MERAQCRPEGIAKTSRELVLQKPRSANDRAPKNIIRRTDHEWSGPSAHIQHFPFDCRTPLLMTFRGGESGFTGSLQGDKSVDESPNRTRTTHQDLCSAHVAVDYQYALKTRGKEIIRVSRIHVLRESSGRWRRSKRPPGSWAAEQTAVRLGDKTTNPWPNMTK